MTKTKLSMLEPYPPPNGLFTVLNLSRVSDMMKKNGANTKRALANDRFPSQMSQVEEQLHNLFLMYVIYLT